MLERSVVEEFCREVLEKIVGEECWRRQKSGGEECCREEV